jgi:hypothetical protein
MRFAGTAAACIALNSNPNQRSAYERMADIEESSVIPVTTITDDVFSSPEAIAHNDIVKRLLTMAEIQTFEGPRKGYQKAARVLRDMPLTYNRPVRH